MGTKNADTKIMFGGHPPCENLGHCKGGAFLLNCKRKAKKFPYKENLIQKLPYKMTFYTFAPF